MVDLPSHLRYLLHRQDLLESDVFSVFDAIQNISNEEMHPLQLKRFDMG